MKDEKEYNQFDEVPFVGIDFSNMRGEREREREREREST
jgi:hypothetical protein